MEISVLDLYLKNVSKYLCCPQKTKQTFLIGLREEICNYDDCEIMELDTLRELFGSEKDVARELMENWDQKERDRYANQRKKGMQLSVIILIVAMALLSVFLIDFYNRLIWVKPTKVIDSIVESDPYETPTE